MGPTLRPKPGLKRARPAHSMSTPLVHLLLPFKPPNERSDLCLGTLQLPTTLCLPSNFPVFLCIKLHPLRVFRSFYLHIFFFFFFLFEPRSLTSHHVDGEGEGDPCLHGQARRAGRALRRSDSDPHFPSYRRFHAFRFSPPSF